MYYVTYDYCEDNNCREIIEEYRNYEDVAQALRVLAKDEHICNVDVTEDESGDEGEYHRY